MSSLTDLSPELICAIIDELPLSSHLGFAFTCRKLATTFQYVLRRHQEAHRKFQVASDLDPSTVLILLRSAFGGDPIPAWHVRSFEVWRDRTTWGDWTTYSLTTPHLGNQGDDVSDMDVLSFQPLLERVGQYVDWFDERAIEEIDREKALNQIESGYDGVLKALLFAKLPRLRDLRFVSRAADKHRGSSLWWLKTLLNLSKGIGYEKPPEIEYPSESRTSEPRPYFDAHSYNQWMRDQLLGHIGRIGVAKDEEASKHDDGPNYNNSEEGGSKSQEAVKPSGDLDGDCIEMVKSGDQEASNEEQALEGLEHMDICEYPQQGTESNSVHNGEARPSEEVDTSSESNSESNTPTNPVERPNGFISLRRVAIGITTGTWMDDETYPCSLNLVRSLYLLPNLDTIYFNGLRCSDEEHIDGYNDADSQSDGELSVFEYDLLHEGSSSVKHIFLEGAEYGADSGHSPMQEVLWDVPRELITVAIKRSGSDWDEFEAANCVVHDIADSHGASVQSLMWYGFENFFSSRCQLVEKACLGQFHALKNMTYHVQDLPVFYDSICRTPFEDSRDSYADYVARLFPSSLECLVLLGDASKEERYGEDIPDGLLLLERVIIHMIGHLSNLKAIFLEEVEHVTELGIGSTYFEEAISAGKAKGVDVYTSRNRPVQHDISFPEPMEKWDMKTENLPGRPAGNWAFDPYAGRRVLQNSS
ncbi:hypothetical protein E8E13_009036 [Curvularia kusanoi]|uniref:F-box domain-containing protein n=1 Tax=Curvularia kusanoi TaxID=90978 RepID=A0A9P4TEL7_CURKU|nr:hypothetical protein E8E13_009036 [Curvularia kusanoi]